jgi:hypothetical protein
MKCLSVAAVALLSTVLSSTGVQQTKAKSTAPPRERPTRDLTSAVPPSGASQQDAANPTAGKKSIEEHSSAPRPHTANEAALLSATKPHPNGVKGQNSPMRPTQPMYGSVQLGAANPNPNPVKGASGQRGPSNQSFVSGGSDTCATATAIAGNGPFNGDNIGATTDGPSNCGLLGRDVWYNWTAATSGSTTFSLCGSTYDTAMSVYDTTACTGALLACNDDFCAFQSQVSVAVTAGNSYKIQIGGFNGSTGNFVLNITPPAAGCACSGNPPEGEANCGIPTDTFNGGCNSAPPVYSAIACGGTVCGTAAWNGTTRDTDWYQFAITSTSTVTWTVTAEYAVVTALLDNNCPPGVFDFDFGAACAATSSTAVLGPGTYVAFTAPDFAGPTFACGGANTYAGALSCVCLPPANDACASAVPISGNGPFTGNTCGATTDGPINCGLGGADVWYDWTASTTGLTAFSLCGSTYDTWMSVYDSSACTGTLLACNDDFCNFQSQVSANVVSGNVYKIQIGGFNSATGSYTLSITPPGPGCACSGNPPEGEANCGIPTDTFNGGCNSSPPVYSSIACGGSVCGTAAWDGTTRDTDWYQFSVSNPSTVTWTVTAEYAVVTALLDNNCPPNILDFDFGAACAATSSTANVGPGTYVAFTAPDFSGPTFPCSGANTYTGSLNCVCQPPANDNCAAAIPISGNGPFNGTNSCATTDGPDPCSVLMGSDVWYDWTAGASGPTLFSLCGSTYDTSIAIYDTTACQGSNLACNDDSCGVQSQATANVVAGNAYKIQIGGFAGSMGNFVLNITPPGPGCPCSGNPPEGEANCGLPSDTFNGGCNSSPPVYSPIACGGSVCGTAAWDGTARDTDWYQFTVGVPSTVTWTVTAEYAVVTALLDNNCPPAILDFDFGPACTATSSTASVPAGTFVAFTAPDFSGPTFPCSGANSYAGTLTCQGSTPPGPCDSYDDGSSETAVGFGSANTDILWMHREGGAGNSVVVFSISTAYGSAAIPGNGPANGDPARVGIWQDTDNDGDPTTGLVLLQVVNTTVANVDTDILNVVPLSPPVVVTGTYFIGADTDGPFPAPLDQSVAGGGRSWICGDFNGAGLIDYNNLNGAPVPPLNEDNVAPGVWLLRADCAAKGTVESFCSGDGTGAPCPCGNNGAPGSGCGNSDHTGGALLTAAGTASLTADTLTLTSTQAGTIGHHSSSLAMIFQGVDLGTYVVYGDGLRCIGSPLLRIFKFKPGNAVTLTAPSNSSIPPTPATFSGQSAALGDPLSPGSVRGYQLVYRDPINFCTPLTFNASNGIRVVWAP